MSEDTYPKPEHGWTCFHCGETFMTKGGARDHFGYTPAETPGCVIKAIEVGEERGLLHALRRAECERDQWRELQHRAGEALERRINEVRVLRQMFKTPEVDDFLRGVHLEAIHQVERWGDSSDLAKNAEDWFWLIGYLAGKALRSVIEGNHDKSRHHCISTAAALYNWHCAISGTNVSMSPGRSDLAEMVEQKLGGAT